MDDSIAQPSFRTAGLDAGGWKTWAAWACAIVLGLLFIVSGTWKITDPFGWAARVNQAKIPAELSMAAALGVGVTEVLGGVLILVPRFRRWGAWLIAALLVVFMIYFAVFYNDLRGEDCSCFPWLKRVVGPGFFISDGLMLAAAVAAGWWSRRSENLRGALILLGIIAVFAGASYGIQAARQTGLKAPDSITVNGREQSLQAGKVLIYFFDPECMHCFEAAKRMSAYRWKDVKVIAVPTSEPMPLSAQAFLNDTGLRVDLSRDLEKLRKVFSFPSAPHAVALENGRLRQAIANFDKDEPAPTLRQLGFIE